MALVVHTRAGDISGVLVGSEAQWRGIPYAAPPLGALRWRPPEPVSPWSGVLPATAFAPPSIQHDFNGGTLGSEDCLYLNVFAPSTAVASSRLPVMVHLHPGGNAYFHPFTNASAFTARGVVVVTLAYRLGVFGFVGHPALTAEGNGSSGEYGLLDQLAALSWVKDNIAQFGGDSGNVTLFGSSAGSYDTVALMASPLSRGLIHRAAVQGEELRGLTGVENKISNAEEIGKKVAQSVGCQATPNVSACLRSVPAAALVAAVPIDIDIVPWVGGKVLPQSPLQALSEGPAIPLLVGFDREEDSPPYLWDNPDQESYTNNNWIRDTNAIVGPPKGQRIRSLYPQDAYGSYLWSTISVETDAELGCPTRRLANTVAGATDVWRYLYTHVYDNDPELEKFRAGHILEDPFIWGNFSLYFEYQPSADEKKLSQRMTDYWTNFAQTGNPNGPGLPDWPKYNLATELTLTFDNPIGVINKYHNQQCGFLDTIEITFPPPWAPGVGPPKIPPYFAE